MAEIILTVIRQFKAARKDLRDCKEVNRKPVCAICDKWKKCPIYSEYLGKKHKLIKEINE